MKPARALLLLLLLAAVDPARAGAQQPRMSDAARTLFADGSALFLEGNYEGALAQFRAAYARDALPLIRFNIAQCLRALNRYAEAIAEWERYLTDAGDTASADIRAQTRGTIRELRRLMAPITLEVEPVGAEVRIDGRSVGNAPLAGALPLAAGRRVLEVVAEGYEPLRDEIEVLAREPRTIRVRLAQRETAATLRVETDPPGARVLVDGLEAGPAPVERHVSAGGHVVEAIAEGYAPYRESVQLAERQAFSLLAHLSLPPPIPEPWERWWFWVTIGGAVALVTGVLLTVFLWPASQQAPVPGTLTPGVVQALVSW